MAAATTQIAAAQQQHKEQAAEAGEPAAAAISSSSAPAAAPSPATPGPASAPAASPAAAVAALGSLLVDDGHAFDQAGGAGAGADRGPPAHAIAVTGVELLLPLALRSADDLATPYTNFTSGYKALLDYVW
jgi:2',5'-phosphodiesterase